MIKRTLINFALAAVLLAEPASKLTIYDFNLPDIDGKMTSFSQFKDKVILIVNVASKSEYTPQYAALESLYEKYKQAGVVVLAFPSNDFGAEEPDPESKIKAFCTNSYHVSFPLFSKLAVRGDEVTPLFHYLTKEANPKIRGDVHWNFTKFVIDRKGNLAARFESNVAPDDPDLVIAIEDALAGKTASPQTPPSPAPDDHQEPRPRAGV
jgi:glutathione peroxidase